MHPVAAMLMLLAAPVALGYTAEELAAKNVEARGGIDKLHAIHSLRFSGKVLINGGTIELGYLTLLKRPQSVRYEAALQGLTLVQAYDGAQAWQINPFQGRKDPEKLSADDAKRMGEDAADFVTRPNGDVTYVYLDPDYFLEVRTVNRRIEHGVPHDTLIDYGDYEKVDGVYFPFAQESGPKGSTNRHKVAARGVQVPTNLKLWN